MRQAASAAIARPILLAAATATAERYEAEAAQKRAEVIARLAAVKSWLTRRPRGVEKATRIIDDGWTLTLASGSQERYWAARARDLERIAQTSHLTDIRLNEYDLDLLHVALNAIDGPETLA